MIQKECSMSNKLISRMKNKDKFTETFLEKFLDNGLGVMQKKGNRYFSIVFINRQWSL